MSFNLSDQRRRILDSQAQLLGYHDTVFQLVEVDAERELNLSELLPIPGATPDILED